MYQSLQIFQITLKDKYISYFTHLNLDFINGEGRKLMTRYICRTFYTFGN